MDATNRTYLISPSCRAEAKQVNPFSMSTPSDGIGLFGVLSETKRILRANRRHFFMLDLLFLLPFAVLVIFYPTLFPTWPHSNSTFPATTFKFHQLLYIIITWFLSISATGTITYSAYHGYYNQPLELMPTLKSLSSSFIPLCSTFIVLQLLYFLVSFLIGILGGVLYIWLESFTWTIIVVVFVVLVCVTYLQMNWLISNVIVVVESKWGYEPLRRSEYLMRGMRKISLKMTVLLAVLIQSNIFMYSTYWNPSNGTRGTFWGIFMGSCWMIVLMELYLVALVVIYMWCMENHGELAMEIQPEEYVSLLVNEDGSKEVDSVVHA